MSSKNDKKNGKNLIFFTNCKIGINLEKSRQNNEKREQQATPFFKDSFISETSSDIHFIDHESKSATCSRHSQPLSTRRKFGFYLNWVGGVRIVFNNLIKGGPGQCPISKSLIDPVHRL